jgi:hypothetical protein
MLALAAVRMLSRLVADCSASLFVANVFRCRWPRSSDQSNAGRSMPRFFQTRFLILALALSSLEPLDVARDVLNYVAHVD